MPRREKNGTSGYLSPVSVALCSGMPLQSQSRPREFSISRVILMDYNTAGNVTLPIMVPIKVYLRIFNFKHQNGLQ